MYLDSDNWFKASIEKEYKALCMVKIQIEHMTGKEAKELVD